MATTINNVPSGAAGGAGELETIMAAHETALLRYATRLLNDPDAAQDIVQESFIKLFQAMRNGTPPSDKLAGWLYRVTHNVAVDYIRRENRLRWLHKKHAAEVPSVHGEPVTHPVRPDDATEHVLTQVRRLPPPEQQVVILRLQEGLSYQEIAGITGRTEGNVGCILHHAVKKIAAGLKKSGVI
jgi:RNA polymerase sigma-70 factor (ECF subfamily)